MTIINLNTTLQRRADLISADMDGDVVMLDVENGKYFGLNAVGAQIWEAIETPQNVSDVCTAIEQAFEVSRSICETDTLAILKDMHDRDMLHIID